MKLKMESHGDLDRSAASAQLLQQVREPYLLVYSPMSDKQHDRAMRELLFVCVQLEAQLRSQGISDFQLRWKSDIRRQDEINENPAAESHGPGPCDKRKWVCSDDDQK